MIKQGLIFSTIILLVSTALVSGINTDVDIQSNCVIKQIGTIGSNHPPIYIDGNDNFTSENGVTDGSGTEYDPHIIEDWIIVGNSSTNYGIWINNTNVHFVIRNCTIKDFPDKYDSGILLSHVENGRIENTISFRTQIAIRIRYSTQIEIYNCTSDDYSTVWFASGVSCYSSSYVTISSCDFHGKGIGIILGKTSYSVIDNSSCHDNSFFGIDISEKQSVHNTVKDCKIYNNTYEGIFIYAGDSKRYSTYAHILRCEIYHNGLLPDASNGEPGITIWDVHENIIEDCSIHHNGEGIVIDASRGNIIRNCSIFGHYKESGMIAGGIDITRDYKGLVRARINKIINCDIYDNELGIFTFGTLMTKIEKNDISNNSYFGIASYLSFLNRINFNNIYDNGGFTPALDSSGVMSQLAFIDARHNWWGSSKGPSWLVFQNRGDKLVRFFGWASFRPWEREPIPDAGVQ